MKDDVIQIRIDHQTKVEAEQIINEMGLSLSAAVQLFLSQVIQQQEIPFKIVAHKPNWRTRAAFRETEKMIKHPEKYKSYENLDELLKELKIK